MQNPWVMRRSLEEGGREDAMVRMLTIDVISRIMAKKNKRK